MEPAKILVPFATIKRSSSLALLPARHFPTTASTAAPSAAPSSVPSKEPSNVPSPPPSMEPSTFPFGSSFNISDTGANRLLDPKEFNANYAVYL
jgi:hypothetical protein